MSEQYSNAPTTTLNGGINDAVTSLIVTSATSFPSSGNFRIIIDSEIMLVTAVSGTTFTVTRGAESSTAASHSNGATIAHILTAGALDTIRTDLVNSGLFANRPSATKAGNLYLPTDGFFFGRDNGTKYQNWGPICSLGTEININDFTWVNQGGATATTSNGGLFLLAPANSGVSLRCLMRTKPGSTPYSVTIAWLPLSHAQNFGRAGGILVRDSVGGRAISWAYSASDGGIQWDFWNSTTSFSSNGSKFFLGGIAGVPRLIRLTDDGTNLNFKVSHDGQNFLTLGTVARAGFVPSAGDTVGIFVDNENSGIPLGCTFLSYDQG